MSSATSPADRRSPLQALIQDIEADARDGHWNVVADRLKSWGKGFRGALPDARDRRQLVEVGMALLMQGKVTDSRGLAPVFRHGGLEAIEALHALMLDRAVTFEPRWFAGQTLAKLHTLEATTRLVAALDSGDEMTTSIATEALGHFGTAEIEVLVAELNRISPTGEGASMRQSLVQALAQINDPVTITPLLAVASDPDPAIRQLAIGALTAFDDPRILPVLIEALRDTAAPIRKVALASLGAKAQYRQQYGRQYGVSANPTREIDWLALFRPLTLDLNLDVATQATLAIGRLNSEAATQTLLELLTDPLTPLPQALAIVRTLLPKATPETLTALLDCCTIAPAAPSAALTLEILRGFGRLRDRDLADNAARLLAGWCEAQFGATAAITTVECSLDLLQAIAYAFGTFCSDFGRPWLEQLADDLRDRVRITATVALDKLPSVGIKPSCELS